MGYLRLAGLPLVESVIDWIWENHGLRRETDVFIDLSCYVGAIATLKDPGLPSW